MFDFLGVDDTPSAPDLQLDWSSSSDSEDSVVNEEDGFVEVLETVNLSNEVNVELIEKTCSYKRIEFLLKNKFVF